MTDKICEKLNTKTPHTSGDQICGPLIFPTKYLQPCVDLHFIPQVPAHNLICERYYYFLRAEIPHLKNILRGIFLVVIDPG